MKCLNLLVVDDCIAVAHDWARLLKRWGHEVTVATDGPTALKAAAEARFDVALLDLDLPGMDGFAIAEALLQHPKQRGIVLIAATGRWEKEFQRRAKATGFHYFLTKPIASSEIKALLQRDTHAVEGQ
jgi:CheY-like chemotaxis protein